jgi:hypothetical protein
MPQNGGGGTTTENRKEKPGPVQINQTVFGTERPAGDEVWANAMRAASADRIPVRWHRSLAPRTKITRNRSAPLCRIRADED